MGKELGIEFGDAVLPVRIDADLEGAVVGEDGAGQHAAHHGQHRLRTVLAVADPDHLVGRRAIQLLALHRRAARRRTGAGAWWPNRGPTGFSRALRTRRAGTSRRLAADDAWGATSRSGTVCAATGAAAVVTRRPRSRGRASSLDMALVCARGEARCPRLCARADPIFRSSVFNDLQKLYGPGGAGRLSRKRRSELRFTHLEVSDSSDWRRVIAASGHAASDPESRRVLIRS